MELDELKNIWKNRDSFQPKLEGEIAAMLRGKSHSIIDKLKRSLWMELIFTSIGFFILLYYALKLPNGALKWSFISFVVLFSGYIFYYIKQLNLFRHFEGSDDSLRNNLATLVANLDHYLRLYKLSYSLLYPIFFILILSFVIMDRGMDDFLETLHDTTTLIYLVFLVAVLFASSLWLTNWYLKKLYGNHVEKLKALLGDIAALMDERP